MSSTADARSTVARSWSTPARNRIAAPVNGSVSATRSRSPGATTTSPPNGVLDASGPLPVPTTSSRTASPVRGWSATRSPTDRPRLRASHRAEEDLAVALGHPAVVDGPAHRALALGERRTRWWSGPPRRRPPPGPRRPRRRPGRRRGSASSRVARRPRTRAAAPTPARGLIDQVLEVRGPHEHRGHAGQADHRGEQRGAHREGRSSAPRLEREPRAEQDRRRCSARRQAADRGTGTAAGRPRPAVDAGECGHTDQQCGHRDSAEHEQCRRSGSIPDPAPAGRCCLRARGRCTRSRSRSS